MSSSLTNYNENYNDYTDNERKLHQQKAVMSHYLGFGNMSSDALEACAAEPGKLTGHAPAGKFKEQLVLKQKQIEEQMIENRIKKLMNEDQRLKKQIAIANKHTKLAYVAQHRRHSDMKVQQKFNEQVDIQRFQTQQANYERNEVNRKNIELHRKQIRASRIQAHVERAEEVIKNKQIIVKISKDVINEKQQLCAKNYATRKQSLEIQRSAKCQQLEQFAKDHYARAKEVKTKIPVRELKLSRLAQIEANLINSLQTTVNRKNSAYDQLKRTSPSLQKMVEPRMAYRFRTRDFNTVEQEGQMRNTFQQKSSNNLLPQVENIYTQDLNIQKTNNKFIQ